MVEAASSRSTPERPSRPSPTGWRPTPRCQRRSREPAWSPSAGRSTSPTGNQLVAFRGEPRPELAKQQTVIEVHGGLEHWSQLDAVSARLVQGGALRALKGRQGVLATLSWPCS